MAMLSLLRSHRGYVLASAFKLRPSVLPLSYVATRYFLTTSPDHSPARKAGKEAGSKPSTAHKSDGEEDVKSKKKPAGVKTPVKPKRFTKKDLMPPVKRPMSSFAAFAVEYRAKQQQDADATTPMSLGDTLRSAAGAWAELSEAEKQTYAPSPEANEAYRVSLKNWQDSLSVEAKRALKLRRRREKGTGYSLFVSETFKEAVGEKFVEKVKDRVKVWKTLSSEAKVDYAKRAAETPFGVRVARAAQHERQVKREAKLKAQAEERKAKEKAKKLNEQAKKKAEQAKLKKAATANAKEEKQAALKRKLEAKKDLERMKREAKNGKKTVKTTI